MEAIKKCLELATARINNEKESEINTINSTLSFDKYDYQISKYVPKSSEKTFLLKTIDKLYFL